MCIEFNKIQINLIDSLSLQITFYLTLVCRKIRHIHDYDLKYTFIKHVGKQSP